MFSSDVRSLVFLILVHQSEMGKTRSRSRIGVRVCRFLLDSEWSFKTKNNARVKCDFDVTIGFPNFENFGVEVELEYDIRKFFGVGLESELNLSE